MEVYVVQIIDRVDCELSTCIELFSTEEKAKEYFQKKAKENMDIWASSYSDDRVITYKDDKYMSLFLDGYSSENSFDMTLTKQEVQ